MFDNLKREWRSLREGKPGQRFQNVHEERRSGRSSWIGISIGATLMLVGIAALALPGPGSIVIVLGLAVLARESRSAARLADWLELRVRDAASALGLTRSPRRSTRR